MGKGLGNTLSFEPGNMGEFLFKNNRGYLIFRSMVKVGADESTKTCRSLSREI
jgi:hypothetical protein